MITPHMVASGCDWKIVIGIYSWADSTDHHDVRVLSVVGWGSDGEPWLITPPDWSVIPGDELRARPLSWIREQAARAKEVSGQSDPRGFIRLVDPNGTVTVIGARAEVQFRMEMHAQGFRKLQREGRAQR